jgi:hypothetical protein
MTDQPPELSRTDMRAKTDCCSGEDKFAAVSEEPRTQFEVCQRGDHAQKKLSLVTKKAH